MATRLGEMMPRSSSELRIEPITKRIRAFLGGKPVVDSERALLVWEPRRVVLAYAVPRADFDRIPEWHPGIPFAVRETGGQEMAVSPPGSDRLVSAFVADDPDLADYVILDFAGFDEWREDDDPIISHPHSPFWRIDIRNTLRVIRISLFDEILAETGAGRLLYETGLPVRLYPPKEHVRSELLPSETVTLSAYKGTA